MPTETAPYAGPSSVSATMPVERFACTRVAGARPRAGSRRPPRRSWDPTPRADDRHDRVGFDAARVEAPLEAEAQLRGEGPRVFIAPEGLELVRRVSQKHGVPVSLRLPLVCASADAREQSDATRSTTSVGRTPPFACVSAPTRPGGSVRLCTRPAPSRLVPPSITRRCLVLNSRRGAQALPCSHGTRTPLARSPSAGRKKQTGRRRWTPGRRAQPRRERRPADGG